MARTVADYTTLCSRQKKTPYRRADGPLNPLVDSTGIKFLGDIADRSDRGVDLGGGRRLSMLDGQV